MKRRKSAMNVKDMVSGTAAMAKVLGKTSQSVRNWEKEGRLPWAVRDYNGRLQAPIGKLLEFKRELEEERNGK